MMSATFIIHGEPYRYADLVTIGNVTYDTAGWDTTCNAPLYYDDDLNIVATEEDLLQKYMEIPSDQLTDWRNRLSDMVKYSQVDHLKKLAMNAIIVLRQPKPAPAKKKGLLAGVIKDASTSNERGDSDISEILLDDEAAAVYDRAVALVCIGITSMALQKARARKDTLYVQKTVFTSEAMDLAWDICYQIHKVSDIADVDILKIFIMASAIMEGSEELKQAFAIQSVDQHRRISQAIFGATSLLKLPGVSAEDPECISKLEALGGIVHNLERFSHRITGREKVVKQLSDDDLIKEIARLKFSNDATPASATHGDPSPKFKLCFNAWSGGGTLTV